VGGQGSTEGRPCAALHDGHGLHVLLDDIHRKHLQTILTNIAIHIIVLVLPRCIPQHFRKDPNVHLHTNKASSTLSQ
jgi:hypothetical protein